MTRQKSKEFVRLFLFFINEIERIRKNIYKEKNFSLTKRRKIILLNFICVRFAHIRKYDVREYWRNSLKKGGENDGGNDA